ncbi:MAG TPA: hypothetical protein VF032_17225 [Thermoleophilaceae bacterium]
MIARIGMAAVAVVVIAWLAVMERDTRLQQRAVVESGRPSASAAQRDYRRARLLNPDTTPDVLLGLLDYGHGRRASAIARLESVLRREPQNLGVWGQLYTVAQGHDDPVARRALAVMRRLDPLDFEQGSG